MAFLRLIERDDFYIYVCRKQMIFYHVTQDINFKFNLDTKIEFMIDLIKADNQNSFIFEAASNYLIIHIESAKDFIKKLGTLEYYNFLVMTLAKEDDQPYLKMIAKKEENYRCVRAGCLMTRISIRKGPLPPLNIKRGVRKSPLFQFKPLMGQKTF